MRNLMWMAMGLVAATGCQSPGSSASQRLPFKVAIVPCTVDKLDLTSADTEREKQDEAKQLSLWFNEGLMTLNLDGAKLGDELATKLDGHFAEATLLTAPPDSDKMSDDQLEIYYIKQATEVAKADLLLVPKLKYSTVASARANTTFYANTLIYLLLGPASWILDDRSCKVNVELVATLHELAPMSAGRARVKDGSQIVSATAREDEVTFDFWDRTDGQRWYILPSLVVPVGLLATDGDRIEDAMASRLRTSLCEALDRRLGEQRPAIVAARSVAPIRLFEKESVARAVRGADGTVQVDATVGLDLGSGVRGVERVERVNRLLEWHLSSNGTNAVTIPGDFQPTVATGAVVAGQDAPTEIPYTFTQKIVVPEDATYVRLVVADGSRSRNVRSFTIPIVNAPSAE